MTRIVVRASPARSRGSCASSVAGIAAGACDFPPASRFVRRRTVCGKPCSTGCSRASPARACWTCSPAAVRSDSRRCRAARRTSLSSSRIGAPPRPSKRWRANGRKNARVGGVRRRAHLAGAIAGCRTFDIVFLDPPYDSDLLAAAAAALGRAQLLAPDARVYLEQRAREPLPALPASWKERSRRPGRRGRVSSASPHETQRRLSRDLRSHHQRPPGPGAPCRERVRTRDRRDRLEP